MCCIVIRGDAWLVLLSPCNTRRNWATVILQAGVGRGHGVIAANTTMRTHSSRSAPDNQQASSSRTHTEQAPVRKTATTHTRARDARYSGAVVALGPRPDYSLALPSHSSGRPFVDSTASTAQHGSATAREVGVFSHGRLFLGGELFLGPKNLAAGCGSAGACWRGVRADGAVVCLSSDLAARCEYMLCSGLAWCAAVSHVWRPLSPCLFVASALFSSGRCSAVCVWCTSTSGARFSLVLTDGLAGCFSPAAAPSLANRSTPEALTALHLCPGHPP